MNVTETDIVKNGQMVTDLTGSHSYKCNNHMIKLTVNGGVVALSFLPATPVSLICLGILA